MYSMQSSVDPSERLAEGNAKFRKSVDSAVLQHLSKGQHPFVAILTCSDARVDPVKSSASRSATPSS